MFVIYTSLRDGSVRKMSTVVDGAIAMVTTAYLMVIRWNVDIADSVFSVTGGSVRLFLLCYSEDPW